MNKILCGDSLEKLKTLPNNLVQSCITSPPYYQLRSYGINGQIGQELTVKEYINRLCNIFDEVKRVLKNDGTLWVNLDDSYGGSGKGAGSTTGKESWQYDKKPKTEENKDKCLLQVPSRFAIEMVDRGWILRNEIIWWKPNAKPESAKDRFTRDYERFFFFSKNKEYLFNQQTVPSKQSSIDRKFRALSANTKYANWDGLNTPRPNRTKILKEDCETYGSPRARNYRNTGIDIDSYKTANMRCVWNIPTKGFREAHFATFPTKLVEVPIKSCSNENDIILDCFGGSGTTGYMAKFLGRQYILIDLNPEYCDIARKRIEPLDKDMFCLYR